MGKYFFSLGIMFWMAGAVASGAQTVVPSHTLRPGDIIAAEDVDVAAGDPSGFFREISEVIGLEVQRALYRGRPIQRGDIGAPALVQRNEIVTLIFQTPTLSIVTEGRALGRGSKGETLRVLNLGSRNTVAGRVTNVGVVVVNAE